LPPNNAFVTPESSPLTDHIFQPDLPRPGPALAAMFLSALLFAVMGICTKAAHGHIAGRPLPASEVTLIRFVFGFLVMLPLHGKAGINLLGTDRIGLAIRGLSGAFAVTFYFLSLHGTSIAHAMLLNYTSIVFAPLLAATFLKESFTLRAAGAITIALAGIVLVCRPMGGGANLGDVYGLLSGLLAGSAITSIRRLRRTESAWSVFFYLCLVGMPVAAIACLFQPVVLPTAVGWLILAGMGASSVAGQLLMTYGYRYVNAAEGGLISLSQLLYSVAAGAMWFGEPLQPATLLGGGLILCSTFWMNYKGAESK
jgi:drug/metabolite transporter (DMT)-like permease